MRDAKSSEVVVRLAAEAFEKLRVWVHAARGEVSGVGTVRREGGAFEVEDVFLLPQRCTSASTVLDAKALTDFIVAKELEDPGFAERCRLWWHSHADFEVFFSGTDEATIERMENGAFLVSLVMNRAGDAEARVDVFEPVRVSVGKAPVEVSVPRDRELLTRCLHEFIEKVHEESPVVHHPVERCAFGDEDLAGLPYEPRDWEDYPPEEDDFLPPRRVATPAPPSGTGGNGKVNRPELADVFPRETAAEPTTPAIKPQGGRRHESKQRSTSGS